MKKYEVRDADIYIPEESDLNWGQDVTDAFGVIADAITDSPTITELEQGLAEKATLDEVYTKDQADTLLDAKADLSSVYTQTQVDTLLLDKADKSDTYTESEVDTLLNAKADQSTTYTKTEVDSALSTKADQSTTYTKAEVDGLVTTKSTGTYSASSSLTSGVSIASGTWSTLLDSKQVTLRVSVTLSGASSTDFIVTSMDLPAGIPTPATGLYSGEICFTSPNSSNNDTLDSPLTLKYNGSTWKMYGSDSVVLFFSTANPATGYLKINYLI